jgi:hypothetical protein
MKVRLHTTFLAGILVFFTATASGQSLVAADDGADEIVGTWAAIVTNLNPPPPPGTPLSFLSLATFSSTGQALEENDTAQIRSTGQGEWVKVGPRQFVRTMFILNFVSPRTFTSMTKAITKIQVDEDSNQYDAIASFQTYDVGGNLLVSGTNTSHGRRCSFATSVPHCMGLGD